MRHICFIDRVSGKEEIEKVYGGKFLLLFYGKGFWSSILAFLILPIMTEFPFFSRFYGWLQKKPSSRKKIQPFIDSFGVDTSEFQKKVKDFDSFNDFFIRKLKPEARPINAKENNAIIYADGRYLFYPRLEKVDGFLVKGKNFCLEDFLQDSSLARKYAKGSMAMGRLCPTDYHRFHFPVECTPAEPRLINGPLYSVNPWALEKNIRILSENKRVITQLNTQHFGEVLYIEIGATSVGSIIQTFIPNKHHQTGAEKGYFSFGGSCVIVLFEPKSIQFDEDLLRCSEKRIEVRCLLGQSMGKALYQLSK